MSARGPMLRQRIRSGVLAAALIAAPAALMAQGGARASLLTTPGAPVIQANGTAAFAGVSSATVAQTVHQATQEAAQEIATAPAPALVIPKLAPIPASAAQKPVATPPVSAQQPAPPVQLPTRPALQPVRPAPSVAPAAATRGASTAPATQSAATATATATGDAMLTKLAPQMDLRMGGKADGGLHLSGTVGIVVMMGLLTLLPTLLLLMTGFTRILIVLHFLRQALGTQNAPPAQLIAALALILTGFVMAPTLTKVNETALQPWMDGKMDQAEMMKTGVVPFREFMLKHTRDHDLQVFIDMSAAPEPKTEADIPLVTLMSAFATSELRTAFQIGFALFLPFIIIDIVVSSVLMSMGMFMLPPATISLPFKLLLFVLVDGWTLVIQSLVTSFRV